MINPIISGAWKTATIDVIIGSFWPIDSRRYIFHGPHWHNPESAVLLAFTCHPVTVAPSPAPRHRRCQADDSIFHHYNIISHECLANLTTDQEWCLRPPCRFDWTAGGRVLSGAYFYVRRALQSTLTNTIVRDSAADSVWSLMSCNARVRRLITSQRLGQSLPNFVWGIVRVWST